jgi:hypothetical protein
MSACDPCTYTGVTPAAWDAIRAAVKADCGVVIDTYTGQAGAQNLVFSWACNPAERTLTIRCLDSPWMDPCSVINAMVDRLIQPFLTAHP